jgi:hypothetical protein
VAAAAPGASAAKLKLHNPRHPERTLLYQTITEDFETWFELVSAGQFDGQGDHHTPKPYVRQAFRKYLECGTFANGFARATCDDCGHDDFVAYSCKGRGFWAALNTVVVDGVFEEVPGQGDADADVQSSPPGIILHPAGAIDEAAVAQVQADLRRRILRAFVGRGLLESCDAKDRQAYQYSEPGSDKRGAKADELHLTPLELIDRIAALVPPPRTHSHRYFGVLASNSPLIPPKPEPATPKWSKAHYLWAVLIARIYEVFPLLCA